MLSIGEPAPHLGRTALQGGAGQSPRELGHRVAPHQPPLLRLPEQVEHHQEGHSQGKYSFSFLRVTSYFPLFHALYLHNNL